MRRCVFWWRGFLECVDTGIRMLRRIVAKCLKVVVNLGKNGKQRKSDRSPSLLEVD